MIWLFRTNKLSSFRKRRPNFISLDVSASKEVLSFHPLNMLLLLLTHSLGVEKKAARVNADELKGTPSVDTKLLFILTNNYSNVIALYRSLFLENTCIIHFLFPELTKYFRSILSRTFATYLLSL